MAQHQKQGCDNRGLRLDVEVVGEFLHGAALVGLGSRRRRAGRDKKQGPTVSWPYLAVSDMQPTILAAARRASRALEAFPRPSKENLCVRNVMGRTCRVWGGNIWALFAAPQRRERQNTATRYLLAVTGSTRAKAAIPEITPLGRAGINEQSLLAPHSLLCSPHPPHPGASLLLVVTDSSNFNLLLFQPIFATLFSSSPSFCCASAPSAIVLS